MEERRVVTSFLEYQGKILVLRRSQKVGSYRGKWAGISGYLEESSPLQQAFREIREETGLDPSQVQFLRAGPPLEVLDEDLDRRWIVHPFLFRVKDPSRISLDWEHVEMRWVPPEELSHLDTVPKLRETWERLRERSPQG